MSHTTKSNHQRPSPRMESIGSPFCCSISCVQNYQSCGCKIEACQIHPPNIPHQLFQASKTGSSGPCHQPPYHLNYPLSLLFLLPLPVTDYLCIDLSLIKLSLSLLHGFISCLVHDGVFHCLSQLLCILCLCAVQCITVLYYRGHLITGYFVQINFSPAFFFVRSKELMSGPHLSA